MTTAEAHVETSRATAEALFAAIQEGAREAVSINKKLGNPIATWKMRRF